METKMIEEIANILETRIVNKTWRSESVAREIYNAGYRKIPEGAFVLTMEDLEATKLMGDVRRKAKQMRKVTRIETIHSFIQGIDELAIKLLSEE